MSKWILFNIPNMWRFFYSHQFFWLYKKKIWAMSWQESFCSARYFFSNLRLFFFFLGGNIRAYFYHLLSLNVGTFFSKTSDPDGVVQVSLLKCAKSLWTANFYAYQEQQLYLFWFIVGSHNLLVCMDQLKMSEQYSKVKKQKLDTLQV